MNLGDVTTKTVPKMSLVAPRSTRRSDRHPYLHSHRVHEAIGVLGAVSVASACVLPGSVAQQVTGLQAESGRIALDVNTQPVSSQWALRSKQAAVEVVLQRAGLLRTARMLMRGEVLIPKSIWDGK